MTTVSDTDIKELKQFISDGLNSLKLEWKEDINQLDKRITEKLSDLKQEVVESKTELKGIDKRLSTVETAIQKIPDLAEKVGEFKNWKQIGVLLLASIFSGTIGSFIGWIVRGFKP
ncbi:MAG: DUF1664 domain-containing protein [Xenococcaceae cyanobacterium MO_188.B32]|nr:DUF1664 domain-containing protein [Xenococcaceae cyanobacterium MO_188.B32]